VDGGVVLLLLRIAVLRMMMMVVVVVRMMQAMRMVPVVRLRRRGIGRDHALDLVELLGQRTGRRFDAAQAALDQLVRLLTRQAGTVLYKYHKLIGFLLTEDTIDLCITKQE